MRYVIDLDISEVEYLQTSMASTLEDWADQAQQDNRTNVVHGDGSVTVVDLTDIFVAQYVDLKALRKRFVDLVGADLTEEGLVVVEEEPGSS